MTRRTVMVVVTEDWYLASHRLPLLRAATGAGWRTIAVTRIRSHADAIRATGAEVIDLPLARESRSVRREVIAWRHLVKLYRQHQPDLVHHVGVKPMLYGGWAARRAGIHRVIQAFAGLGHLYTEGGGSSVARLLFEEAMRPVTRRRCTRVLAQNDDDAATLIRRGVATRDNLTVVRGSGVDLARFQPTPLPGGVPVVLLPARMLASKGVREFVAAARQCRAAGLSARFVLAGRRDDANPEALSAAELNAWVAEGVVEWRDHVDNMPVLLAESTLVALPSYREGMPKSLLEAAAAGRAIVTTDVPGCREVVRHGVNGLLVPVRNAEVLGSTIGSLLADRAQLEEMGVAGRARAEQEFSDRIIAETCIALYDELMKCSA